MTQNPNAPTQFHAETLPCGLRIVCAPSLSEVAYCGVAVDAGTRDELDGENGLAHFCEHLSFKGTRRRRSWHILNRMEAVGGDLNAYTGKEETVYYAAFLRRHFARAADLLTDIVLCSTFPQNEMNKEVEVVIDEIESYNDSPAELIFDDFESLVFDGHPLGKGILGEADRLRTFRTDDVARFASRLYRPASMVFFVLGNIPPATVRREVEKAVGRAVASGASLQPSEAARRTPPPAYRPREIVIHKHTHQAHVMIGARAYSVRDPRHLALRLLNNILGGPGMNSRLNLSLRERHGLVYTVESNLTGYTDTGVWSVYFGCDPRDVGRCRRLVLKELRSLASAPLPPRALDAAKRQFKGQIGIALDNSENVALSMGKRFLHYGTTQDNARLFEAIDALRAEDLHAVAQELFREDNLTFLAYE